MIEVKKIDQTGATIDQKWEEMRQELQNTRKAIQLALQQLINMRKEQVAYKIFLEKEIGVDVDPDGSLPNNPTWKNRSCEKSYLQSELVSLVDQLQALDPRFRFDPDHLPSTLSTSQEVLMTTQQMEDVRVLYQNYSVYRSENEWKAAEALKDYLKMRGQYEVKLLHNNAMTDEINATRKRIKELKIQAVEDKCFMKFLVTFKLYKERQTAPKATKPQHMSYKATDLSEKTELQKYKKLWRSNVEEKEYFMQCTEALEQRLKNAHHRMVQAERICMSNSNLVQDLERKVHTELIPTHDQHAGFQHIYRGVSGKMAAALHENETIRQFLQQMILPKEKDFSKLWSSLEAKADQYRAEIVELTPKPPEPEPQVEEKPGPKAKKKKGKKKK